MYLIAGLGNPGKKYTNTKHNVGFMVISKLQEEYKIPNNKVVNEDLGLLAPLRIANKDIILCEPLTYMNLSGDCIVRVVEDYNIPLENVIIIYDDFDLPVGEVRIRAKGGPGTQNGMKSVVYSLDSTDFPRIRVGTGPKPKENDIIDYVLSPFTSEQEPIIEKAIDLAAKAAILIVTKGVDYAMNEINKIRLE